MTRLRHSCHETRLRRFKKCLETSESETLKSRDQDVDRDVLILKIFDKLLQLYYFVVEQEVHHLLGPGETLTTQLVSRSRYYTIIIKVSHRQTAVAWGI